MNALTETQQPDELEPEMMKDLTGVPVWKPSPFSFFCIGYPEPYWHESYLPLIHEDMSSSTGGIDEEVAKRLGSRPFQYITTKHWDQDKEEGSKPLYTFEWKVLNLGNQKLQSEVDELMKNINNCNPYLWGAYHGNRLKRGTKIYFIKGAHKGQNGVVVGHPCGFNLKNGPDQIIRIHVLLADEYVWDVRQDEVKLVDLHQLVPFGVPKPPPKKKKDATGWGAETGWGSSDHGWNNASKKSGWGSNHGWCNASKKSRWS